MIDRYKKTHKGKDSYFYFACNMHWEKHDFELPRLPRGYVWDVVLDTSKDEIENKRVDRILTTTDRSIVVLEGHKDFSEQKAVVIKNKIRNELLKKRNH